MTCLHENIIEDGLDEICEDCGIIVNTSMKLSSHDVERCSIKRINNKSIYKDIEHLKLESNIAKLANNFYIQATSDQIFRGKCRKSLIFASIYQAYKLCGVPQSCDHVLQKLNITKKAGNRGLYILNKNLPKESEVQTIYVNAEHIIIEYMKKYSSSEKQIKEIISLYKKIKNSENISRLKPKSIAAGLIYYYIQTNSTNSIKLKAHSDLCGVSAITIKKVIKYIETIIKEEDNE